MLLTLSHSQKQFPSVLHIKRNGPDVGLEQVPRLRCVLSERTCGQFEKRVNGK